MTKRERRYGKEPRRTATAQPSLLPGTTGERESLVGYFCQARKTRIDTANCIVAQTREPGKCIGCGQFKS